MRKCNSDEIKIALAKMNDKYGRWFGTEVRTGGSYFHGNDPLLIFDGLMVEKSYTRPQITGYEIKVSRSDFLNDNKWHLYLKYCNIFYFVCPTGMIKKEELSDDVGLLYYNPETCEINPRAKKKASWREIEDPLRMYQYIVYSQLDPDRMPFYSDKKEFAKAYLENKESSYRLGQALGTKLAKEISRLRYANERADDYERTRLLEDKLLNFMYDHGEYISYYGKTTDQYVDEIIMQLQKITDKGIDAKLHRSLSRIVDEAKTIKEYVNDENS